MLLPHNPNSKELESMEESAIDVSCIATRLIADCATLAGVFQAGREINAQHRKNLLDGKDGVENMLGLSPQAFSFELEAKRQAAKAQLEAVANNLAIIHAHLNHLLNETCLTAESIEEHQRFLDGLVRHMIRKKGRGSRVVPFGKMGVNRTSRQKPKNKA